MSAAAGTVISPRYFTANVDVDGDVSMNSRHFIYNTDEGVVAGWTSSVMFTIDAPAPDVWPVFKDFNLWQNDYDHFYSEVIGDAEGKRFHLLDKSLEVEVGEEYYEVVRSIPEHVYVITQPIPENGGPPPGLPGLGRVRQGFHVFMLSEREGKTVVTVLMQHESYAAFNHDISDDEALAPWREMTPEWQHKWLTSFIPVLKRAVYDRAS